MGLWLTVQQCEEELKNSQFNYDYKFVVISNGEDKLNAGALSTLEALDKSKKLIFKHFKEPISPPKARQIGVDISDSEYLFFFDNHCLPARDYFDRAKLFFDDKPQSCLFSSVKFYYDDFINYHYIIHPSINYNFWGSSSTQPLHWKPYPIAMSGHGGFACHKQTWADIGGYGDPNLLVGYGGEEPVFCYRAWMKNIPLYLHPKMLHYHYPGDRSYSRHYTNEYYKNVLTAAYICGGDKWLLKLTDSLINKKHIMSNKIIKPTKLAENVFLNCKDFYLKESKLYKTSLDDVLLKFGMEGIAH